MMKFAGIDLPSYVKINAINYSILPPINHKSITVEGRAGVYDGGVEFGAREIECDIQIIGDNDKDVMKKARLFSTWLFHEDLQPLIIDDEPDKQYNARIINDTGLKEVFRIGEGSIKFICPDAYAESISEKEVLVTPIANTIVSILNEGSTASYPVIDLTLTQDASSIMVVSEDKFMQVGYSDVVDKTLVAINPDVLVDDMNAYTGWTTATNVDGGSVTGTFVSDGMAVKCSDYGTGTTWHGASAIKSLSREVQDFMVQAIIGHNSSKTTQIGRVEIYLLDVNNVHLGKIALTDAHVSGDHAHFQARAGGFPSVGKYFIDDYGNSKGVWADFHNGYIKVQRLGNRWWAYIGKVDPITGVHHTRLAREWYDTKNLYTGKLAKIQIHIGSYSTYEPVNSMFISHLRVREESVSKVDTSTNTPIVFKAGDVITFDNQKAIVLQNGEPAFHLLDPSSDFFALKEGSNGLIVSPSIADMKVRFRERWM